MKSSAIITLTTDFGTRDWFVGTMKGVILGVNPKAALVDLTHEIPPGDIRAGAFSLAASYNFYPKGTVHLVVVDPGVGSSRRALAVQTERFWFVGPDNGVLSWALARQRIIAVHALRDSTWFLRPVSRTFHGRDIFAPVAAHLSRGIPLRKFGPALEDYIRLQWPKVSCRGAMIEGQVLYIDRFGNAITNIEGVDLKSLGKGRLEVHLGGKRRCGLAGFYQAVRRGGAVAIVGSSGFLELAINGGNAAEKFKLGPGTKVTVSRAKQSSSVRGLGRRPCPSPGINI